MELPRYYGAADVFVLPSRYELFGIVMLEAMACGVPVVATRFGGLAEVIAHGETGFLVDPTDTTELARRSKPWCATGNSVGRWAAGRGVRWRNAIAGTPPRDCTRSYTAGC